MKHFNFLSKQPFSLGSNPITEAQWKQNGSTMKAQWLRFVSILVLVLTFGVGQMWGAEAYIFEEAGGTSTSGWTFTNGTTTNAINQSGYWLLDAGSTKDSIITSAYDLSSYETAIVYMNIQSYGSGSHNALKVEISYNGGTTWAQTSTTSVTTTSSSQKNVSLTGTLTNNVKIRLSNNGSSGRGIRVTNFKLKVTYTPVNHTVNWYVNGSLERTQTGLPGTNLTSIPAPTSSDCGGLKSFVGWTENSSYSNASTAPSDLLTSTTGMKMPNADKNYYAVFATEADGSVTKTQSSFSATSASSINSDTNLSYSTAKGGGTSDPFVTSNTIRLYQIGSGNSYGGYITISSSSGTISSVTIGSAQATSVKYSTGTPSSGPTAPSSAQAISANGTYTADKLNTSSITFYCMGSNSSSRLEVNYLSITYSGGKVYSNYATSCCTSLGSINGSIFWNYFLDQIQQLFLVIYLHHFKGRFSLISVPRDGTIVWYFLNSAWYFIAHQ